MNLQCINIIATWMLATYADYTTYRTIIFDTKIGFEVRHIETRDDLIKAISSIPGVVFSSPINSPYYLRLCSEETPELLVEKFLKSVNYESYDPGAILRKNLDQTGTCFKHLLQRHEDGNQVKISELNEPSASCNHYMIRSFVEIGKVHLVGKFSCIAPEIIPTSYSETNKNGISTANHLKVPEVDADVSLHLRDSYSGGWVLEIVSKRYHYRLYLMGSLLQVAVKVKGKGELIHPCFAWIQGNSYRWKPTEVCGPRPSLSGKIKKAKESKTPQKICAGPPPPRKNALSRVHNLINMAKVRSNQYKKA